MLQMGDSDTFVWDDGQGVKSHSKLASPDLEDTVKLAYPAGAQHILRPLATTGRARVEVFLRRCLVHVLLKLKTARTGSVDAGHRRPDHNVQSKPRCGGGLRAVSADLSKLPPKFYKYLRKTAGFFHWRKIAGTSRLSTHAFGIAIDLNVDFTDYWRWSVFP